MRYAFGDQCHDLGFGQRFLELDAEAVSLDPSDNSGKLEMLAFEQQSAADRKWRRRAAHCASLRDIEQYAVGLAMDRKEGDGEHHPMPAMTACIELLFIRNRSHRPAHSRIAFLPMLPSWPIIPNDSLIAACGDRFFARELPW